MSSSVDDILRKAASKKARRLYKGDASASFESAGVQNATFQAPSPDSAGTPAAEAPNVVFDVQNATLQESSQAPSSDSTASPAAAEEPLIIASMSDQENARAPSSGKAIRSAEASSIIARHAALSAGAGFVPIPFADYAANSALQISMAKRLAALYEVPFALSYGRFVALSLIGSISFDCVASVGFGALARFVPPLGIGFAALQGTVSSGVATLALGHILVRHLEAGGQLDDAALPLLKKSYQAELRTSQASASAR